MMHLGNRRRVMLAISALAIVVSVAACGSRSEAGAPPLTAGAPTSPEPLSTASSPAPTVTSGQAEALAQKALSVYRAAFADWSAVEAIPDKDDYHNPRLADHLTGAALSYVTGAVYVNTSVKGAVARGNPVLLHPTVGQMTPVVNPTQILVNDCVQTDNWLLYTTDGHPYNNVPGGKEKTQALVTEINGAWKVSQLVMQTTGTC